jgi:hypothetical protein
MRKIKVMADYQCFPLWEASAGVAGNIDPDSLPISDLLKHDLLEWADRFDATLDLDDPVNSRFKNEAEERDFRDEGEHLAKRLQDELGDEYEVVKKI